MTQLFPATPAPAILGVVLAGGRSQRMAGTDKTLLAHKDSTLLERVVARAAPQVDAMVISANSPSPVLDRLQLPVVADLVPDFPGPLAGIVSAMEWAEQTGGHYSWLASFAADTPFVPADFVACCMADARSAGADVAYASSKGRHHYAMAVWRLELLPYLKQQLAAGEKALKITLTGCKARAAVFGTVDTSPCGDPFFNINTPADWTEAQRYLQHAEK